MKYSKTHDLAVKVGEYQKNGETKGRYENIGQILSDGENKLLMVKRTFNPAGVPNPDGKDSVIISTFKVQERDAAKPSKPQQSSEPFEDEIPF